MRWVAALGIVIELIGLGIAISGLNATYKSVVRKNRPTGAVERPRSLPKDLAIDLGRWWNRVVLRRKSTHVISVVSTIGINSSIGSAFVTARPPTSPEDASTDDQVAYLMALTEDLSNEIEATRRFNSERIKDAEERLNAEIDTVRQRVESVSADVQRVSLAAIGPDGAGLRKTAVGFAITFIGVLLSMAGVFS